MNNTFDIKRFGLVFRKDLVENGKRYMLSLLTMLGLMALVLTLYTSEYYSLESNAADYLSLNNELLLFLLFMFFGFGIWFASTFSAPMNHKLKRLSFLVSPSSNLEKYLVRWMITTIGFVLAFFATMWIADILRVVICSAIYPDVDIRFIDITKLVSLKDDTYSPGEYMFPKGVFSILISLYFLLQSLFILGSTCWEKASFIKTFTAGAAIFATFILICRRAILLFYGDFDGFFNVLNSFELSQKYSSEQAATFAAMVISVFTLTFWILAYFRMKESEITNRL